MALPYTKLSTRLARARRTNRFLTGEAMQEELGDASGADQDDSAPETLLGISCSRTGRSIVMVLHGELDLFSRPHLERELKRVERDGLDRMVVDLSGLEFMDGAGMHALLGAQRRATAAGRQFLLRRGPRDVHRLFVLTGVEPLFSFEAATATGSSPA
jgi:anti-sigma B factor antagonist